MTAPEPPLQLACYTGGVGSATPCSSSTVDGDVASFRQDYLPTGVGLSVIASYPGGTFGGVQPILAPRRTVAEQHRAADAGGAGGRGARRRRRRRRGRARPTAGAPATARIWASPRVCRRRRRTAAPVGPRHRSPIAVQFTPPPDVLPGEMGTLTTRVADHRDVTATIIDLAVRGYLRIEEVEGEKRRKPDWRLVRVLDRRVGRPASVRAHAAAGDLHDQRRGEAPEQARQPVRGGGRRRSGPAVRRRWSIGLVPQVPGCRARVRGSAGAWC